MLSELGKPCDNPYTSIQFFSFSSTKDNASHLFDGKGIALPFFCALSYLAGKTSVTPEYVPFAAGPSGRILKEVTWNTR